MPACVYLCNPQKKTLLLNNKNKSGKGIFVASTQKRFSFAHPKKGLEKQVS